MRSPSCHTSVPASPTHTATSSDAESEYLEHVRALNKQFAAWVVDRCNRNDTEVLAHGATDYLRHACMIKRDNLPLHDDGFIAEESSESSDLDIPARKNFAAQLTITPTQHVKTVHFIRHGEAFHNIGVLTEDSHLTERGWGQASRLRQHIQTQRPALPIQVVICSPLVRALETAVEAFGSGVYEGKVVHGRPLMLDQEALPGSQAGRKAVAATPGLPFVAFEGCRERLSGAICDRRGDLRAVRRQFPGIDFSHVLRRHDTLFDEHSGETQAAVTERGQKFLQWLSARPEQHIAVVTHAGFLFLTLSAYGHEGSMALQEDLHRPFANAEMRSVMLADSAGGGLFNPTWFPGALPHEGSPRAAAIPPQAL